MDLSGAAFPCEGRGIQWDGLTKRELYAAMAMQGVLAHIGTRPLWDVQKAADQHAAVEVAVQMADALIDELAKEEK